MVDAGDNFDWSGQIAITGMGLVTPVGLYAEASLAALRAGISRLSRIPHFEIETDEGEFEAVIGAEVPQLTRGRLGPARLNCLMAPAFSEVLRDAAIEPRHRIGVFLGTAGSSPAERVLNYNEAAKEILLASVPEGFQITHAKLIPAGRAAVLRAIRSAAQALDQDQVDIALIGAVDSWVTPRALSWLLKQKRLNDYPRKTGTVPAEAAGFLALEKQDHAQGRSARVYAHITSSSGRNETVKWGEATNAVPLSQCIQNAAAGVNEPEALVISDLCGERYRAMEWGMALPKAMWSYENLHHWNPGDCIGDSGAAMGVIMLAWAAEALRKGYAPARQVLVWGASDEGAREAAVVTGMGGNS